MCAQEMTLYQKHTEKIFSTSKSAAQKAQFKFFLISEAQRNFHNELRNSVERKAISERHLRSKSATSLPPMKFHDTMQIPHFLRF